MENIDCTTGTGSNTYRREKGFASIHGLLLVMLLALTIRLAGWNLIESLYRDTANFITKAGEFSAQSLKDRIQEPLHPLILHSLHNVFFPRERGSVSSNYPSWEFTVFADGAIFTLICLWLLYAIGKYLHSPAAGLWAAFFLAIIPYGVEYSIQGLSELPYLALVLLSLYLVLKSNMKNGWLLLAAGACAALVILTRKDGIILPPIILLYLLCRRHNPFTRKFRLIVCFLAGITAVFFIYYLAGGRFYWLEDYVGILRKLADKNLFKKACAGGDRFILALHPIRKGYEYLTMPVAGWFKLSGFVPAILFLIYLFKRRSLKVDPGVGLLMLYAFFHILMGSAYAVFTKYFVTRYLFPACVVLFPIAGLMMVEILAKINLACGKPADHRRAGLIAAFVLLAALTAETVQNCYTSRHPEISSAARWLEQNTPENTLVFASDDRVGLYCRRPWKNVVVYNLSSGIQTLPDGNRGNYLAVSHKTNETGYVQSSLNRLRKQRHILADPVQTFTRKKNQVTIYRLRETPATQ